MYNKRKFILICKLFILSVLFHCNELSAQLKLETGDVIDRIIAIVGNEIVLKSDIDAYLLDEMNRSGKGNLDDKDLRQKLLDALIESKLMIVRAEEDTTISVSDELVDERWNILVERLLQVYGSIERVEAIYKKSMSRLKLDTKDHIKQSIMSEQLEQKQFSGITVNTQEVDDFYKQYKDSLMMIPEQVELYHIVKYITSDSSTTKNTLDLAKSVRDSILNGADFTEMAKKYSADNGSVADGGDLGWVAKGMFVSEYENAAFNLQSNEISMPVESPFGFHIIKLIEKKKDSIHTAHILFKLVQSDADIKKTQDLLDSLRDLALTNGNNDTANNFETLAKKYSDDKATQGFGGLIGKVAMENIPLAFAESVKELKDGEITTPLQYSNDPTKQGMHIIWRKKTIPEHSANINDDYEYIKNVATQYKMNEERKKYIAELKKTIYWEIFE